MPKILYAVFGVLFFICCVGGCLYFVGGVSATYPPLRTYDYEGSPYRFENAIQQLVKSETDITFKVTDRVGSKRVGFANYMTVYLKTSKRLIEYRLKCESKNADSKISLIRAFDEQHMIGGYGIKANGMNELLNVFEKDFLVRLKNKQNIVLVQDRSFWTNFSIY